MGALGPARHGQIAGSTSGGAPVQQHGAAPGAGGQGSVGAGAAGAPPAGDVMSSNLQVDGQAMASSGAGVLDEAGADHLRAGQQEIDQQANNTQKTLDLLDVYIDAKDSVNNWCVAKIIDHDMQSQKLQLHFDGWSPKYDEVSTNQIIYLIATITFVSYLLDCENRLLKNRRIQEIYSRLHRPEQDGAQRIRHELRLPSDHAQQDPKSD